MCSTYAGGKRAKVWIGGRSRSWLLVESWELSCGSSLNGNRKLGLIKGSRWQLSFSQQCEFVG